MLGRSESTALREWVPKNTSDQHRMIIRWVIMFRYSRVLLRGGQQCGIMCLIMKEEFRHDVAGVNRLTPSNDVPKLSAAHL
jgi:hypothetical protein